MAAIYPACLFEGQETVEIASVSFRIFCALGVGLTICASDRKPLGVSLYQDTAQVPQSYRDLNNEYKTTYALQIALVATLAVNAAFSLASFVYAFIGYDISAHYDQAYIDSRQGSLFNYIDVYDKGTCDLATWVCETKDIPSFDDGRLSTLCVIGSGARWITLILFPLSFALYIFVWLDQRGEQQLLTTRKNRRASWSEDYY